MTALIALILALGVVVRARADQERPSPLAWLLPASALLLSVALGGSAIVGIEFPVEAWLAGPTIIRDGVPLGRISIITCVLFSVVATALLVGQTRWADLEGRIAALSLSAAFVVLQGYILGAPLLYGSRTIPVAAPTAIIIWLLSAATLLRTAPLSWPLRLFLPIGRLGVLPSPRGFIWLAALFSAVVMSSGYFWYASQREQAEAAAVQTLRRVAQLKAEQIAVWYGGIKSSIISVARAPLDGRSLAAVRAPGSGAARAAVESWLAELRDEHAFEAVVMFGADGRELLRVEAPDARPLPALPSLFAALRGDTLHTTQVYEVGGAVRQTFWVPVHFESPSAGAPDGWLACVLPLDRTLFPIIADYPGGYRTGDYSLWGIERDSVRLVSQPRDADLRPLDFALPRDSATQRTIFDPLYAPSGYAGPGFSDRPIRAVGTAVPGTNWQLVVKVDEEELRAPILAAAVRATIISLAFLLGVAAITYALWYRRDLARTRLELSLIEDRERGLREIEASEQRYARAMRGTTDGLWDLNLVTGEAYVSPRWLEIAGNPDVSAVRSEADFQSFLHPDDVPRQREALRDHLAHGTPYDIELRVHPRLGLGERWIRTRAEAERDADGRPVWMSGAITDVTRQHLAEAAVERSERLLRVRNAVNQAIVRAEDETSLLQMACEIGVHEGGYRMVWIGKRENDTERSVRPVAFAGEERGYLAAHPVTWGDGPSGQGPTGRCIRSGTPQLAQDLLNERNYAPWREAARERGFQSSASIPLVVDGEIFGALMLYAGEPNAFDTTEIELLSDVGRDLAFGIGALRNYVSLREQREQLILFRQAIDRSADAIFVADTLTGKFVDFNVACLEQLGYTAAELAALGPADVVPDIGARGGLTAVVNGIRAAGGVLRPTVHRRKDGSDVPVEVALSVLDLGPRTLILGIARDISDRLKADSEREELQQMLNRAQKMESVGRLAGGVAHDFNNLLTVINATAELALGEVQSGTPLHRDLQEIRAAGDRAAALTRQLLAFSRQQVLKREVLSLNDVVSAFLKLLSRVLGEDIHLELRLGRDVPSVVADANQLEQVLMNLCVNARDAMPRGGTLTIGTGVATVDEEHAARREGMTVGRCATLWVSDTGVGMDKATQAKIFEPFFTTKETGRGTGLGLSTVYGIVKQTGGSVWVYSEVGQGTTFRIYLPATDEVADEPSATPARAATTGRETILVVEDEESIRMVARRVLQRAGYTVLEAPSGDDALAMLATYDGPLDLVMTDLVMPGMTGIELANELRARMPQVKMLFTSGYAADVVSDRFTLDAEWNFIAKPYGMQELAAEVRRVLDA